MRGVSTAVRLELAILCSFRLNGFAHAWRLSVTVAARMAFTGDAAGLDAI
jgi:hypothetical protein